MRVITGVHNDTADGRSDAHMTFTAGFAKRYDFVVDVADLTDGRFATRKDISHFAAGKTYGCVLAFFCHKLRFVTGCSAKLCAATGVKFDIMDNGTDGNVFDGKAVACFNIRIGSAYYHVADGNSERSDDVAFFAVCIVQKCDVCGTVGIVLDGSDLCGDTVFIAFEVDNSVFTLLPPPMCLTVILPFALRPPDLFLLTSRLRSGVVVVTSSKVETVMKRREGVVGLNFLIAIVHSSYYARLSKNSMDLLSSVSCT